MKRLLLLLLLGLSACTDALAENPPQPLSTIPTNLTGVWQRFNSIGSPYFGHDVPASTTGTMVTVGYGTAYSNTDEATIQLIPFETMVVVLFPAITCVCFMLEDLDTGGIGSFGQPGVGNGCGSYTDGGDPGDTTNGPCFKVPANLPVAKRFGRDIWTGGAATGLPAMSSTSRPGYRSGRCSSASTVEGYPCDADDDCPSGGSGSCVRNAVPAVRPAGGFIGYRYIAGGTGDGWVGAEQ